jgi:hypothetical protein
MGQTGSRAEYSLAPVRGMAGDARGAGAAGGVAVGVTAARAGATVEATADAATTVDAVTTAGADTPAGQLVASMGAADFMVPQAAASTAAVVVASMGEAVGMAEADIGNRRLIRRPLIRERLAAGAASRFILLAA